MLGNKAVVMDEMGAISTKFINPESTKSAVSTVGNGSLLAQHLLSGLIMRTGPTGAYADTLDSAANIVAAMGKPKVGDSFDFIVVNGVAFINTITAGSGITLAGVTNIAASAIRMFRATVTNPAAGSEAVMVTGIGAMTA